jgi:hypothetical protein
MDNYVIKAHRIVYHSTLGSKVMRKNKKTSRRKPDQDEDGKIKGTRRGDGSETRIEGVPRS